MSLPANILAASNSLDVTLVSSRPNTVSGGKVLLKVRARTHTLPRDLVITLNGEHYDEKLHSQPDGTLLAMVAHLTVGQNLIGVADTRHGQTAHLKIINHPIDGPIFSGPHQTPFICQSGNFPLPNGNQLGKPLDRNCSIATHVDYIYRSTDGSFKPLLDPHVLPSDLIRTTTLDGAEVNYIVRVETGTINRAIYQIAVLDSGTSASPLPWDHSSAWNRRLVYVFGGGCSPGYHQGTSFATGGPINDVWLSKGFAAASSSLNVFANNCNDVISAETMMMVKEHFILEYGEPQHTIGWGQSGGSMQQQLLSSNYPGLLDGITPGLSFPDAITFFPPIADCPLLTRAFDKSTFSWTTSQKAAVAGWGSWSFCTEHATADWSTLTQAGFITGVQVTGCNSSIPLQLIYNPVSNPTGARCTWFDNSVNIFGRDSKTGFAKQTLDNEGVQYGLLAFNSGEITADQFIELNGLIGGYDTDGHFTNSRMIGDSDALRIAYETGRVNEGRGLSSIPIIDYRNYRDSLADVHDSVRSQIMRARLVAANSGSANQVLLMAPPSAEPNGTAVFNSLTTEVLRLMDLWLTQVDKDTNPYTNDYDKIVRDKPRELMDACYDSTGNKITDVTRCSSLYPVHGNPRLAAGQPLTNDILKCQLKRVESQDYSQAMTTDQLARLRAIFPRGVCDYSRPGVGQSLLNRSWLGFPQPGTSEPVWPDTK